MLSRLELMLIIIVIIITVLVAVSYFCDHDLTNITTPVEITIMQAKDIIQSGESISAEEAVASGATIEGAPTVVGAVCRHALSGSSTPIGPITIHDAAIPLCATCTEFDNISFEIKQYHEAWQWAVSQGAIKEDRKRLSRFYEASRLEYERAARRHQELADPALPMVNHRGVALLLSLADENQPAATPRRAAAKSRGVTFDDSQPQPSRETARSREQYKRTRPAYVPGRYAAPKDQEHENTAKPTLYRESASTADDEYMRHFGFEERNWWQTPSNPAKEGGGEPCESENDQAGGTETQEEGLSMPTRTSVVARQSSKDKRKKAEADYEESLGSFSAVYTQSSPPVRAMKADQNSGTTSPESEK
jgi:hypothetical protein